MNMNRRTAVKNFLIFSAGVVFIPSCFQEQGRPSIVLTNINISSDDEDLMAEVCETFIPATGTPGAKDIGAHLFVLKMLDDCTTKEDQQKVVEGLKGLDKLAKKEVNKTFISCTPKERADLFALIESKKDLPDEVAQFYTSVKKLTIQAFTTSKYFLTNVHVYEMVPSRFHGCVPVKSPNTL